jgi:hypothetical protein
MEGRSTDKATSGAVKIPRRRLVRSRLVRFMRLIIRVFYKKRISHVFSSACGREKSHARACLP